MRCVTSLPLFSLRTGEHFRRGLESLGLDSKRGSFDKTTEEKWWGIVEATDSFHSIIKEVCDAIDEDRMRRMRESEQRERCKMFLEDQYAKSYRERKFMHDEDHLTNYFHPLYGSTFLKMPPRHSFIPTSISLPKQHRAPPPPPWRIDGATGVPCEAPPLSRDCASRNSYRSLFTRDYVCNEAELVQCPAALSTTLHMQLGFDSLRLSRNQLPSILSLQLTCRKYVWVTASIYALLAGAYEMLTEMNCSRNKISTLPADIGICKRMRRIDLSNNHLHDLPATFTNMPRLVRAKSHLTTDSIIFIFA